MHRAALAARPSAAAAALALRRSSSAGSSSSALPHALARSLQGRRPFSSSLAFASSSSSSSPPPTAVPAPSAASPRTPTPGTTPASNPANTPVDSPRRPQHRTTRPVASPLPSPAALSPKSAPKALDGRRTNDHRVQIKKGQKPARLTDARLEPAPPVESEPSASSTPDARYHDQLKRPVLPAGENWDALWQQIAATRKSGQPTWGYLASHSPATAQLAATLLLQPESGLSFVPGRRAPSLKGIRLLLMQCGRAESIPVGTVLRLCAIVVGSAQSDMTSLILCARLLVQLPPVDVASAIVGQAAQAIQGQIESLGKVVREIAPPDLASLPGLLESADIVRPRPGSLFSADCCRQIDNFCAHARAAHRFDISLQRSDYPLEGSAGQVFDELWARSEAHFEEGVRFTWRNLAGEPSLRPLAFTLLFSPGPCQYTGDGVLKSKSIRPVLDAVQTLSDEQVAIFIEAIPVETDPYVLVKGIQYLSHGSVDGTTDALASLTTRVAQLARQWGKRRPFGASYAAVVLDVLDSVRIGFGSGPLYLPHETCNAWDPLLAEVSIARHRLRLHGLYERLASADGMQKPSTADVLGFLGPAVDHARHDPVCTVFIIATFIQLSRRSPDDVAARLNLEARMNSVFKAARGGRDLGDLDTLQAVSAVRKLVRDVVRPVFRDRADRLERLLGSLENPEGAAPAAGRRDGSHSSPTSRGTSSPRAGATSPHPSLTATPDKP